MTIVIKKAGEAVAKKVIEIAGKMGLKAAAAKSVLLKATIMAEQQPSNNDTTPTNNTHATQVQQTQA